MAQADLFQQASAHEAEHKAHNFFFSEPEIHGDGQPARSDNGLRRLFFSRQGLVATALVTLVACFACTAAVVAMGLIPGAESDNTSALAAVGEEMAEAPGLEIMDLHVQPVQEFEEMELEDVESIWINRDADISLNVTGELSHLSSLSGPARRLGGNSNCAAGLAHLKKLDGHHLVAGAPDSLFPATMASIAPPGSNCGDTAAGTNVGCAKYNTWRTFQEVADARGKKFEVFAASGTNWHDIGQGELGNCYFLAALASVAYSDPHLIDGMFVNREKWAQNIYTTKWLINGKEMLVEVDNHFPSRSSRPYFVRPSSTGEWWPVILEKAWAKIFSTYKATEGGQWANTLVSMTAAPLHQYTHGSNALTDSQLFAGLQEASNNGWPMGACTVANSKKYGLSHGHVYAVFKASIMAGHGKVVEVFNPWGNDNYHGAVPNANRQDGVFTMTLAEFRDSFFATQVAKVTKNTYKTTSTLIQSTTRAGTVWKFHVGTSSRFWVSVRWPMNPLMKPCDLPNAVVTLSVAKAGSAPVLGQKSVWAVSTFTAEVSSGPGDYTAAVAVDFMDSAHQREAHLLVYAEESVVISKGSEDPGDAMMRAISPLSKGQPCHVIYIRGRGNMLLKKDVLVHGVPTFWSSHGTEFAYWHSGEGKWFFITSSKLARARVGDYWRMAKYTKHNMVCGCHDDPNGVPGFGPVVTCARTRAPAFYNNVMCQNTEYSELVQQYCPVTCGADYCKKSLVPAPAPPPPPPPSSQPAKTCSDHANTGFTVNGAPATCHRLRELCGAYQGVNDKCCATCGHQADKGGVSNDHTCKDHSPPGLRNGTGKVFAHCSQLANRCHDSRVVRARCCATCKIHAGSLTQA